MYVPVRIEPCVAAAKAATACRVVWLGGTFRMVLLRVRRVHYILGHTTVKKGGN